MEGVDEGVGVGSNHGVWRGNRIVSVTPPTPPLWRKRSGIWQHQ